MKAEGQANNKVKLGNAYLKEGLIIISINNNYFGFVICNRNLAFGFKSK